METHFPIFTLPMMGSKAYVIASPELTQSALRSKNLSFEVSKVNFAEHMFGGLPEDAKKILKNLPDDPKEPSFMRDFHKVRRRHLAQLQKLTNVASQTVHENLLPGPKLQLMNNMALRDIATQMNGIQDEYNDNLWIWLRNSFTIASSNALFGEHNILAKSPSLIDGFWWVP
jgi:hypothetical protein